LKVKLVVGADVDKAAADENKAGRCVRESKSRSLLRIELKQVVVSDEDKAGRCLRKVKRVVASVEVKAGLTRFVVADENKAGRCVRESKSRSLLRIELKLVVVSDEDKAGRCFRGR
jgi:hypothetical protein